MIVRLTNRQRGRVGELLETAEPVQLLALLEWYGRDCQTASKHRVDMAMPAAAWRIVEHVMFDFCFDGRGFKSRHVRTTDLNALKSVRRALNARESHPALWRIGAVGIIGELIPAWKFPAPDASGMCYTPYPTPTMPFVILAPETRTVAGKQTTLWVEAVRPTELPLLDEREHLRFAQL